jgi:hypothetical protein
MRKVAKATYVSVRVARFCGFCGVEKATLNPFQVTWFEQRISD